MRPYRADACDDNPENEDGDVSGNEAKVLDQHAWIQQQRALYPRAKWEFSGPGINPSAIEGVKDLPENAVDDLFGGVVKERFVDDGATGFTVKVFHNGKEVPVVNHNWDWDDDDASKLHMTVSIEIPPDFL